MDLNHPYMITVVIILLLGGCASNSSDSTPSTHSSTQSELPTRSEEATAPTPSGGSTDSSVMTVAPDDRLVITKVFNGTITVSMYEYRGTPMRNKTSTITPDGEPVSSVTFGSNDTGILRITDFEPDGIIVVSTKDKIIWRELIHSYDHYRIYIGSTGDVEVREHSVV